MVAACSCGAKDQRPGPWHLRDCGRCLDEDPFWGLRQGTTRLDVYNRFFEEARTVVQEAASVASATHALNVITKIRSARALLDYIEQETILAGRTLGGKID